MNALKTISASLLLLLLSAHHFQVVHGQSGTFAWEARHGLTSAKYQETFDELNEQGYRPICVSGYSSDDEERYAAIWEKRPGPAWEARQGLTSAKYQATFTELKERGYRPMWVNGYAVGDESRYAAIWEKSSGPAWVARHDLTSARYQETFDKLNEQGYRPICVSGYTVGGEVRYAAFWEKRGGPAWEARHGLTSAEYQFTFDALNEQGYRPICVSGYTVDGQVRYAAIWEKRGGPAWEARHGVTAAKYQTTFDELKERGYRPVCLSGYTVAGEARYAAIWER
jgi:uncharacterized protein (UPF0297 family)